MMDEVKVYLEISPDGEVVNSILWDGISLFPCKNELVEQPADLNVGIGWTRANGTWLPPAEPNPE